MLRKSGTLRNAAGRSASTVLTHVGLSLTGLALWIGFLVSGNVLPAWLALAAITAGNSLGDSLLIARGRRLTGERRGFWPDYGAAIAAVFRGRMPRTVIFHALFAGVVFFSCLGVCIGATIAAAA
ncbi:hypothetical protein GCM10011512_09040 [Tersicoccus solisilvae]|uniref:Uncharacterized protein n=1 Tax=Tersicoccus solisilvae TaxID=1882339 RepID=A0ABQ1NSM2_9MICC|nr:hypothetical protein [Tersicoccus solisilvae]GGC84401.1 hypothetical protein GCM10011512_09040 [Tersicoccus solisilvae]